MNRFNYWNGACAALLLLTTAMGLPAQTFTALASFNGGSPGDGALIQAIDGNFYGTAGAIVFKITPSGELTTLESLAGTVGSAVGGLIQASDGNFYGTTFYAGGNYPYQGTVFKLTPSGTLAMLYSFCSQYSTTPSQNSNSLNCADGANPWAGLVQGSDGNLYGTTLRGGTTGYGTVFKITLGGALTTLYSFCSEDGCADGATPYGVLIQGSDGNFYGTTSGGEANDSGTVFKITPSGTLTTLYNFDQYWSGANPVAGLVQASDGDFYGTTSGSGANGDYGTVFKITPGGALTILYSFCPSQAVCTDGQVPEAGLIQASDGNFYGTTDLGGAIGLGTVFKITPSGTFTTVHSFSGPDGKDPPAGLVQGSDGNLYGTTQAGGTGNDGTVFKLSLASSTTSPAILQTGGLLNGASFQAGIVPGSWVTIFGTNLSSKTDNWASAIANGKLPTSLDNVEVKVGGEPAYISYISPKQIDAVAPNVGTGAVEVTVTNSSGTSPAITATAQAVQPAFFQWGNYAVATTLDYNLAVKNGTFPAVTTTPAKPGEVIVLWGTGFGPTSPSAPEGVETPSSPTYNTANTVSVTVGGKPTTVYGAALAPGYAGLYQVAIQIPASLANGDYPVVATISGAQSPSTTLITVQE